jgi:hypothetical protein
VKAKALESLPLKSRVWQLQSEHRVLGQVRAIGSVQMGQFAYRQFTNFVVRFVV